jgi:ketosteroid isomerase-like protein
MRITTLTAVLLLLGSQAVPAAEASDVAQRYLAAYSEFDIDRMADFYAEDAVFIDPTTEYWGEMFVAEGRQAIVDKLKGFVGGFDEFSVTYHPEVRFDTAGYHIVSGMMKTRQVKDGDITTSCAPVVTIVSIKGGKVTEHRDYFDYEAGQENERAGEQDCPAGKPEG